jgi:hypothetical protein
MNAARILYRTRQFWNAVGTKPAEIDLQAIRQILTPRQMTLFSRLQPGEQAHSIHAYHMLIERAENHPDLITATLLHDVGKTLYPLHLWERGLIVLAKALFPRQVKLWGRNPVREKTLFSWQRPFVIAEQHPAWGADLAARAGTSPLAVSLIRRHQEIHSFSQNESDPRSQEDQFLSVLQSVDNES